MEKNIEEFRDGIFSLNTRRFGTLAELMIKKIYEFNNSHNLAYDLLAKDKQKIEVKFSRVLKKCSSTIIESNLVNQVISSKLTNRMLTFEKAMLNLFDCNIQQVKTKEFSILYYGCFFEDKILIFKIHPEQIIQDKDIFYSNHQHRGNTGEGQFHVNTKTISHHLDKYLVCSLSYEDLYNLFKNET